jgi:hypothetical protein
MKVLALAALLLFQPLQPPPPPPVIHVSLGQNPQDAINAAGPGQTIQLQCDVTFIGNLVLPNKSGRVTLRGCNTELRSPGNGPVLQVGTNWQVVGTSASSYLMTSLTTSGDHIVVGSHAHTVPPTDVYFEYVHTKGNPTLGDVRGWAAHGAYVTVTNSKCDHMKQVGRDAQCFVAWNGPGPYTLTANHFEAAGEIILFGGSDPSIAGLVPRDLYIGGNTLRKPIEWCAQSWANKNTLELKSAERVTIIDNTLDQPCATVAAPTGYNMWLTAANQDGACPQCTVRDVLVTRNRFYGAGGISIAPKSGPHPTAGAGNIRIFDNWFTLAKTTGYGSSGRALFVTGVPDVSFEYNDVITNADITVYIADAPSPRLSLVGNILPDVSYGVLSSATGEGERAFLQTAGTFTLDGRFQANMALTLDGWLYDHGGLNRIEVTRPSDVSGYGPR